MTKIKCKSCGYEWETGSELEMVTCPNCQRKAEKENKEKEK